MRQSLSNNLERLNLFLLLRLRETDFFNNDTAQQVNLFSTSLRLAYPKTISENVEDIEVSHCTCRLLAALRRTPRYR